MLRLLVTGVLLVCGCVDVSAEELAETEQSVVSGPFTMTLPPTRFVPNQFGIADSGAVDIAPGTLWLSASLSITCGGSGDSVKVCARIGKAAQSTDATTVSCSIPAPCSGPVTIAAPFTGFAANQDRALSLYAYRTSASVVVNGATLNGYAFGD